MVNYNGKLNRSLLFTILFDMIVIDIFFKKKMKIKAFESTRGHSFMLVKDQS